DLPCHQLRTDARANVRGIQAHPLSAPAGRQGLIRRTNIVSKNVSPNAPVALKVENLRKSFGTNEVLQGISLEARAGEVMSIVGSSGSGKSTFLRCINLLEFQ